MEGRITTRPFEGSWAPLAERLRRYLLRRGIPSSVADDVVQETGLRLLLYWDDVDPERPLWPLVRKIAGRVLWKSYNEEGGPTADLDLVEGLVAPEDVEGSALARADLQRIYVALSLLTERQRDALLAELGIGDLSAVSDASLKMLRMRARRRLRHILEHGRVVILVRREYLHALWNKLCIRAASVGSNSDAAVIAGASAAALLAIMAPLQSTVPERRDVYQARVEPGDPPSRSGGLSWTAPSSAPSIRDLGAGSSLLGRGPGAPEGKGSPTLYQQAYTIAGRAHEETWSLATGHYRSVVAGAEEGSSTVLGAVADAVKKGVDRIDRARSTGSLLQTKPKAKPKRK